MAPARNMPSGEPPELIGGPADSWIPEQKGGEMDQQYKIGIGELSVDRVGEIGPGALMGKTWRNPVTGIVQIKRCGGFQDFHIADLWTRSSLNGSCIELAGDPYLFRPIPMATRTWIYHYLFRMGRVLEGESGADEDAMIKHILAMHCIDAQVSGGRWAPVLLHVPMILFLALAADLTVAVVSLTILLLVLFIQWATNSPECYRWSRPIHLPLRLVLLGWIVVRMGANSGASAAGLIGFLVALVLCIVEMVLGDGGAICAYRLHCSYEVLQPLPNRIFVCRRHGAAHSADVIGRGNPVDEKISGFGHWASDYALIADVKGLIVELRPMDAADWKLLFQEKQIDSDAVHRYIGLDVYSPGAATVDALSAAIDEQQMLMQKNQQKQNWKVEDA